ncbi:MAG: FtsX-like permease family protein [Candidatus Sigynarchaeota archaeon]
MPFASFVLGFKLVWRNKRRFVVVMSGLILAISIIGALFLVASNQSHEMGVSYLYMFRRPISLSKFDNTLNMTEYDALDDMVLEADALGTDVVDGVFHEIRVSSQSPTSHSVAYFFTKNDTINWPTFVFNSTAFDQLEFVVKDDFSSYSQSGPGRRLIGRTPVASKEIMVSESVAIGFNITINNNISICNVETEQMVPGYKVVGILPAEGYDADEIFIQYPDFLGLHGFIGESDNVYLQNFGFSILKIQIDLSSVTIFNVNDIVEKVNLLASRINVGLVQKGYSYQISNEMEMLQMMNAVVIIFIMMYLLLMVGMLLPAIILAGYISKTISLELFERRATEFGQFRSRGFSRKQMIRVLLGEILVSSLFCCAISAAAGVGLSYLFQPIAATFSPFGLHGSAQAVFSPFIFPETAPVYAIMMGIMAFLFVLFTYMQPMKLAFQRDLIDSLKEKVKASRQERKVTGGIVAMYLFGLIPLVLYLLLSVLPPGQAFTQIMSMYSPIISTLSIGSPFFLALATIKLIGEKKSTIFGRLCTFFLPRSKAPLRHVATRNITSKSATVTRLSMIVLFTIAFGFCVKTTFTSLTAFREEKMHVLIGSEISGQNDGMIGDLNATRVQLAAMANVTRSSSVVSTYCMITNQADPLFTYQAFYCDMMNVTEYLDTISAKDDKYLYGTTWHALASQVESSPDAAILPSSLASRVRGTIITVEVPYFNGINFVSFVKNYTVVGYYKVFPGLIMDTQGYYLRIILNENPWNVLKNNKEQLYMTTCIDTPFADQKHIDDAAAAMNFTTYRTMTNMSDTSSTIGMQPLLEMPIFYNLLDIDNWLAVGISLFGVAALSFMRITKERKEIGLFRIRGFDTKMIYATQLAEKFMPILIGGLVGILAGIIAGWIATTTIALNFVPFNPLLHYPIGLTVTGETILIQAIIPMVLYLGVILVAIQNEIRQSLGSIMDEED